MENGINWQFQIDGQAAGPVRNQWIDAAIDALNAGYATPIDKDHFSLPEDTEIVRVQPPD